MPLVTFAITRDAGDENTLTFGGVFTVGPNSGNVGFFFNPGQTYGYSTSGNGPGSVGIRVDSSTQIGLDDRQGAGSDNDYNDLIVRITSGNATFSGGGMFVNYDPVVINSFTASPNPQNSSNATRQYSTRLSWSSTGGTSASITSNAGETFSVGTTGALDITNLPQSTVGSNSPATRNYTLTVSNPQFSGSSPLTVSARNDNFPSNGWTTSFSNLSPSTTVTLTLGTLSGVDMPTTISVSGSGNFIGNGGSFSGARNFTNGQTVQLRTTTLPYNTSLSGVGSNATFGNTNTKTVTVSTPSGSFNVNVITAAPRIKEVFNYADSLNKYPFEDIDLITNTPLEYVTTAQIEADDIDIPQEIKVDQPDAQVRINSGSWQNVREI